MKKLVVLMFTMALFSYAGINKAKAQTLLYPNHPFVELNDVRWINFYAENGNGGDYQIEYWQFYIRQNGNLVYMSGQVPADQGGYWSGTLRFHRSGVLERGKTYTWSFRFHSRSGFSQFYQGGTFKVSNNALLP